MKDRYGCGLWLPEDKKANMWHGREKYAVAYGRLPSPAGVSKYLDYYLVYITERKQSVCYCSLCL